MPPYCKKCDFHHSLREQCPVSRRVRYFYAYPLSGFVVFSLN